MPIKECTENKKPGWKYGDSGKCYIVEDPEDEKALLEAKKKAIKQAIAIHGSEAHLNEAYRKIAQEIFNTYIKFNYKYKSGTVDESNKCGDSGSEKTLKIGDSFLPINKDGTGSHDFVLHKSFGPNEIKKVKN